MSGRSLERVQVTANDAGDPVLTCLCDCATTTDVVLADLRPQPGGSCEFAYTCDDCQTPHWITLHITTVEGPGGTEQ